MVKETLLNMKTKSKADHVLKIDGVEISDTSKVANEFNKFFNSVPQSVKSAASFKEWSPPHSHLNSVNSLFLGPSTPEEIISTVHAFENKGPGDDGISVKFLKAIVRTTATALAHTLNLSFDTGVYPDKLKISQATTNGISCIYSIAC